MARSIVVPAAALLLTGAVSAFESEERCLSWPLQVSEDHRSIPSAPQWVERLSTERNAGCELLGDPNSFDYVVRLTTWAGLTPDRVVYVDATSPFGGDGSSWTSAYQSLHDALDAEPFKAELVDIRVAQGLYRADRVNGVDTLDAALTFVLPGITVTDGVATGVMRVAGGFAGRNVRNPDARDLELYPTVFTGDLLGNDTEQHENYEDNTKVMFEPGLTELNGLTIEHARKAVDEGRWVTDCVFRWCYAPGEDLALNQRLFSPVLVREGRVVGCTFHDNSSPGYGGALTTRGFSVVANSRFLSNTAMVGGAIGSPQTILPDSLYTELVLQNCFFSGNMATSRSGGLGGAVFNGSVAAGVDNTQIVHCTFTGNQAVDGPDGAISSGRCTIYNCVFDQNFSSHGTGVEAELPVIWTFESITPSKVKANVFRRYNERLEESSVHPNVSMNRGTEPGFHDLLGPDGILGTFDDDPALADESQSIGWSLHPPAFPSSGIGDIALFDIADLDADCDRTEPLPIDMFGNPRAFESAPGEGVSGYAADAGCVEYIPGEEARPVEGWVYRDPMITDFSEDPVRLHVRVDAPSGGDGLSWATAFANPSEAIGAAAKRLGPVEIWVAQGEYSPQLGQSLISSFRLMEHITMLGGFVGSETSVEQRDPELHETVLTGDVLGNDDLNDVSTLSDNARQVVISVGPRGGGVLDGFTVRDGVTRERFIGPFYLVFNDDLSQRSTAGLIYVGSGSVSVRNCTLGPRSLTVYGDSLSASSFVSLHGQGSSVALLDTHIVVGSEPAASGLAVPLRQNRQRQRIIPVEGAGMMRLENVRLESGRTSGEQLISYFGRGIDIHRSVLRGIGSMQIIANDHLGISIRDSLIRGTGLVRLDSLRSPLEIRSSTVVAGSVRIMAPPTLASVDVSNCVFATPLLSVIPSHANSRVSASTFPASFSPDTLAQLGPTNTTFDFKNKADAFFVDYLGPDGLPGTGDEDLRLAPGSPAINTGLNEFVDSEYDLDGNPRIIAHVVDRGAYEFTGTCTGDVNGDGVVNLTDLNMVLANFGEDVPFGDASGDGAVDLADLNIVLGSFGHTCSKR